MEAISHKGQVAGGVLLDEAVARVAAYLVCLGFSADRADLHAREILDRHAENRAEDGRVVVDTVDSALAEVMSEYETWLDWQCGRQEDGNECFPAIVAWNLRPVLSATPEVFLQRHVLPESVGWVLEDSLQCPLPEPAPAAMPTQSFGELPAVLRAGFWRSIARRIASLCRWPASRSRER
jgi:hypothetical protein